MPPVASRRSCDVCRKRKTKCLAQSESAPDEAPCANCARLRLECTYNYVPKRSGRPSLSAVAANNQQSSASASTSNGDGRNPSTSSNGLRHGSGNDSSARCVEIHACVNAYALLLAERTDAAYFACQPHGSSWRRHQHRHPGQARGVSRGILRVCGSID